MLSSATNLMDFSATLSFVDLLLQWWQCCRKDFPKTTT